MPIYEYSCKKCGHVFEMFRAINSDDRKVECPKCGEKKPKRLYSIPSRVGNNTCIPKFSGG